MRRARRERRGTDEAIKTSIGASFGSGPREDVKKGLRCLSNSFIIHHAIQWAAHCCLLSAHHSSLIFLKGSQLSRDGIKLVVSPRIMLSLLLSRSGIRIAPDGLQCSVRPLVDGRDHNSSCGLTSASPLNRPPTALVSVMGKGMEWPQKTGTRYQTLGHPSTTIPTVALVDSTIDSKVASLLCVGALFNLPNYLIAYCHSPLKTNKKRRAPECFMCFVIPFRGFVCLN